MGIEHLVDFARCDILAALYDQFLEAPRDKEIALCVLPPQIAGAQLAIGCEAVARVLRGQSEMIAERLERDLAAMSDLPAAPFDACNQATGRVSSQALVRYKTNDYSARSPTATATSGSGAMSTWS